MRYLLLIFSLIAACNTDPMREPIPPAAFNEVLINLTLPAYNNLNTNGGHVYLSEGVRGIILYRENSTTYHAYERNCSYLPYEAGSTVNVHTSNLYMHDPSCGSSFSLENGYPSGGPARFPLREYRTVLNGSTLTVTDEIVSE